jgi:hypothetical protein
VKIVKEQVGSYVMFAINGGMVLNLVDANGVMGMVMQDNFFNILLS